MRRLLRFYTRWFDPVKKQWMEEEHPTLNEAKKWHEHNIAYFYDDIKLELTIRRDRVYSKATGSHSRRGA